MKKITVYGRPDNACPNCRVTGHYLKRLKDVEIEKINVDEDAEALELIKSKGFSSVPIFKIGERWFEYVGGVPTERIRQALEAINE